MILLRRFIPFLITAALLFFWEWLWTWRAHFWLLTISMLVLTVIFIGYILYGRAELRAIPFLLLLPIALVAAGTTFLVFLGSSFVAHLVVVLNALLLGLYAENLFLFYYQPHRYQPYALEHISIYLNVLIAFYAFSAIFAARIFLNVSFVYLLPVGACIIVVLVLHQMWSAKVPFAEHWVFMSIMMLVMLELFGSILYLPTTFFASGLFLIIPYYVLTNIARHRLRGSFTPRDIARYAVIGSVALLATLLTAPWH